MADVNLGLFTNACRSKQGIPGRLAKLHRYQTGIFGIFPTTVWLVFIKIHGAKRMIICVQNKDFDK